MVVLAGVVGLGSPRSADAADLSQFRPGNIISNQVFFDSSTMTADQIQTFLQQKVPSCQSGYTCLPWFRQDTTSRAAGAYCAQYQGAASETAATIISKVATACGINPQVLIVMLQKEQGLVTHTWPSDWRYTIAMGQGCPDTAACDKDYYGFQNQVYGAARQMRIYGQSSYFTWYAPGQVANVLFNPNQGCGSSPVFIENQATANLYYYTPYQPNSAALAAGYGDGDGCSSYGNRNFFNYFSDWFGSTQQSASKLIRADGDSSVWLINGGRKFHVRSYEDLLAFQARMGAVVSVSARYVNDLPTGGWISRYVHDVRTGTLYLLEADGTRHRFASAAQISQFGYDFGSYIDLDSQIIDRFAVGPDVNDFRRVSNGAAVYLSQGGNLRYVQTMDIWNALSGGAPLYAASMDAAAAAPLPIGPDVLPINALVREANRPEVYVVGGGYTVTYVPDLGLANDFGASQYFVINPGTLANFQKPQSALASAITCGQQTFVPSAGSAVSVTGLDGTGLIASVLPVESCVGLPKASTTLSPPFFVSVAGSGSVYRVVQGKLQHVLTYDDLVALNGARPLTILSWSPSSASRLGYLPPALKDHSFVQFVGSGQVYYVDGGALRYVSTYDALLRLGGGVLPSINTVEAAFRSSYLTGATI